MQIYFHSRPCSYLPRVPILVEGTVVFNDDIKVRQGKVDTQEHRE